MKTKTYKSYIVKTIKYGSVMLLLLQILTGTAWAGPTQVNTNVPSNSSAPLSSGSCKKDFPNYVYYTDATKQQRGSCILKYISATQILSQSKRVKVPTCIYSLQCGGATAITTLVYTDPRAEPPQLAVKYDGSKNKCVSIQWLTTRLNVASIASCTQPSSANGPNGMTVFDTRSLNKK